MIEEIASTLLIVMLVMGYVYMLEEVKLSNDGIVGKYKTFSGLVGIEKEGLKEGVERSKGVILYICALENATNVTLDGKTYNCSREGKVKFRVYGVII